MLKHDLVSHDEKDVWFSRIFSIYSAVEEAVEYVLSDRVDADEARGYAEHW